MVEAEQEDRAVETLRDVYFELKAIYDKYNNEFIFFNKMKSPIKRLKNKYRYQVLMRINNKAPDLRNLIFDGALKHKRDKVTITIEENPSSLS